MKFSKTDCLTKNELSYVYRNNMINDLIKNYKLVGLTRNEIINLLGSPENYSDSEPNTIYYNIVTEYGNDIDPVSTKNLKIKFNTFDKVESFKIIETE